MATNPYSASAMVNNNKPNAKSPTSNTTKRKYPAPANGGHLARLVEIIFLGQQSIRKFGTEHYEDKPMVRLTFELVNSMIDRVIDEETGETEKQPHWVSREIPVSNSDKSTFIKWATRLGANVVQTDEYSFTPKGTKDKVTVRQFDADYSEVLGNACQVFIQVDEWEDKNTGEKREAAKIKDLMEPMQGLEVKELFNEDRKKIFSPYDPSPLSVATFNELPSWVQDKITSASDWESTPLKQAIDGGTQPASKQPVSSKAEEKQPTSSEPELMTDDDVPFEADAGDDEDPWK